MTALAIVVFPGMGRGEPLRVNLAARTWINDLQIKMGGSSMTSGFDPLLELSTSFRWERYFIGLQASSVSYRFERQELSSDSGRVRGSLDVLQFELGLGYYITPGLSPFWGYLSQIQDYRFVTEGQTAIRGSQSLGVGMIGVIFNWPLSDRREVVFGKLTLIGMGLGDVGGGQAEIGISHLAKTIPISYSIGVKYQDLSYRETSLVINQNRRTDDVLVGFNAGLHYTLR